MAQDHLTQAKVDVFPYTPKGKREYIWDEGCPGLALVVNPTTKTWRWQIDRWVEGEAKKKTIYKTLDGAYKLKEARTWAEQQRVLAKRGAFDPKPAAPEPKAAGPEAWTVKEALNKRLEWMKENGFADTTVKSFEKQMIPYLAPIHDIRLGDLTKSDCQKVHAEISKAGLKGGAAPVSANAALNYLSATWLHAKDKHDDHNRMPHRSDNPCLSVNGTPNACSALYGAAARTAKAMGFARVQTYTLASEPGTSLRAAGWVLDGQTTGGDWNTPARRGRRTDQPQGMKLRWVR